MPDPKNTKKKGSISVSGPFFARLERWCAERELPINAVVEITALRAMGVADADLPPSLRVYASQVPNTAA